MYEHLQKIKEKLNRDLSAVEKEQNFQTFMAEYAYFFDLDSAIKNSYVQEIMINSWNEVWIEKYGQLKLSMIVFDGEDSLKEFVNELTKGVDLTGRYIVNVRTSFGHQAQIVFPPVSLRGAVITIRKFPHEN